MKITFKRSVAVSGEHHEQGTSAEIPDIIAIDLIRSQDAVSFATSDDAKPEKSAPETAMAKHPGKENASKK